MKVIAMIPARYEASRFPGKLMKDLAGKTVILRTYEATKQANLFDEVYVVGIGTKPLQKIIPGVASDMTASIMPPRLVRLGVTYSFE